MNHESEVIALLVDESPGDVVSESDETTGAHRLVREPDGRVLLERVESQAEFDRMAKNTGCFRRGRAIRDPETKEVIGYEMEEIAPAPIAVSG